MTWDITLDFEYVVTKKPKPRICFLSAQDRDVMPIKGPGLSPFMRRIAKELRDNIGPGTYEQKRNAFSNVQNRIYSKYGLGAKSPRWITKHEYQPPLKELRPKTPIKQNCAPFNATSKRKGIFSTLSYPAPCDYCPDYLKRQMKFAYSFSGKKILRCPVEIKCVPYNLDECGYSGCSCSQQGDYWQFENRIFLCRKHYDRLFKHCLAKFQGAKLAEFKSVRDCFFMHSHNSCKAAMKIMKSEDIVKKLRKEAYLDLFFPQRRFCDNVTHSDEIMKLDSNNKMINSESGADLSEEVVDPRQNAEDIIDEILAEFTESRSPDAARNGNGLPENLFSMIQPPRTRTPANSFSENATIDDIDPQSDLGTSIRNKCLELEEILQSLKSRLNHVVLDENIVLSPEANSMEAQLEHDLDTDCQEDLSLQEFLELLHSQNKISPTGVQ